MPIRNYPGLGWSLRHNPQDNFGFYPIGAHGSCYGSESFILPVREIAMMSIMEKLTDKENWHKKVFDDSIVEKWWDEASKISDDEFWKMSISAKSQYWSDEGVTLQDDHDGECPLEGIMNKNSFFACIEELKIKAKHFEKTGIVPTLDACASAAKSDTLVSQDLRTSLRAAFEKLKKDQETSPDWHPNSNNMVQDLVHPSMYPLVYGRSRVLREELVGVEDAVEKWAGKGEIIPKDDYTYDPNEWRHNVGGGTVPPQFWSDNYQWLPANVAFKDDGTVQFTSYINNLHPKKHAEIYRTIEQLVQTALPMWDQCLALASGYNQKEGAGRLQSRFSEPDCPDDENEENWTPKKGVDIEDLDSVKLDEADAEELQEMIDYDEDEEIIAAFKRRRLQTAKIPEPDDVVTDYSVSPGKTLAERYKETGLQIIVKLATIELTPEKPDFPVGGWHVEGQMNEHICATALYYLDSENISPSSLSFRMQTSAYLSDDISVGQNAFSWLEAVYGTSLGSGNSPCLQNYGTVETKEGRLLAFPNVFQHRVSPFSLQDPTKPGHRRFIALWLVDPNIRIISTANVPPQQQSWWADAALGSTPQLREETLSKLPAEIVALLSEKGVNVDAATEGKLPIELMEMVRKHFNADAAAMPMSEEEAREHRAKLMVERSAHHEVSEREWQNHSYSFCEH